MENWISAQKNWQYLWSKIKTQLVLSTCVKLHTGFYLVLRLMTGFNELSRYLRSCQLFQGYCLTNDALDRDNVCSFIGNHGHGHFSDIRVFKTA